MRVVDVEQGSEEWKLARLGKVGASMVADATARTKTGWGASRANLAARLVAERLTGALQDSFVNDAMRWGTEREPEARSFYEFVHGVKVDQVGLVLHPKIDMAVASPDGLIGDNGLIEIKCPNTATHIETLRGMMGPVGSGKSYACAAEIMMRAVKQKPSPIDGYKGSSVLRCHRQRCNGLPLVYKHL